MAIDRSVRDAGISGAASGGIMGGLGSLLSGTNYKTALRNAAIGSLIGGGLAGGGVAIGNEVMGEPERGETNPYTRRGTIGGAVAGAGAGTLAGGALAKDYIDLPKKLEPVGKYIRGKHPLLGAILGGIGGSALGAWKVGDEGMQVDFIQSELDDLRRRRRRGDI